MIEKIISLEQLQSKYNFIQGRKPVNGDLVYVPAQQGVFEVIFAHKMEVRIDLGVKGTLTLPFSHYKLVERKPKPNKKK